ncbi:hypothetical protein EOPP23_16485 [Endozoicomonas sp. OPT23]|uniref:DNA polymerase III subunit chi n=1 Tax=Endozoicomonas sp. OPT23 TaxID=2072845 RepID=UPI00129B4721|nr:DNA polymerase III subunit chi [Endozoicomonas sp. OPT23]MRI34584.1 hypothetical protein [Endozoicomonas sp. OPT23]
MQVTFYLLQQQSSQAVKSFVCKLTEKAWTSGMKVHIHTDNQIQSETYDRLLWEWREDSFIPHEIKKQNNNDDQNSISTPVTISHINPGKPEENTLLINMARKIPAFYRDFDRTCEVVDKSPGPVEILREKFKAYQKDGIKPEAHDIAAGKRL